MKHYRPRSKTPLIPAKAGIQGFVPLASEARAGTPVCGPGSPLSRGRAEESVLETVMDAFRINSLSEAAGGANFDARVCIQLPRRHDTSEK